jgi:hypothetical protein
MVCYNKTAICYKYLKKTLQKEQLAVINKNQ